MEMLPLESLPLGFRFRPTDEELVNHYLKGKINGRRPPVEVIPEIDVCKCEPWDLPEKSVIKNDDREWFFFAARDWKYPNGNRSNRATEAGYWKATGKDRKIMSKTSSGTISLIGMKKTLVFHRGRAPKGERTPWIMHEYRTIDNGLDGKDPYVLCRLFKKKEERIVNNRDEPCESGSPPSPSKSSPDDPAPFGVESEATINKEAPLQELQDFQQPLPQMIEGNQCNNFHLDVREKHDGDWNSNMTTGVSDAHALQDDDWLNDIMGSMTEVDSICPDGFPRVASPIGYSNLQSYDNINQSGTFFSGEFGYQDVVPDPGDLFSALNATLDWNLSFSKFESTVSNTAVGTEGLLKGQAHLSANAPEEDFSERFPPYSSLGYHEESAISQNHASSSSVNSADDSWQEPFGRGDGPTNQNNSISTTDLVNLLHLETPRFPAPGHIKQGSAKRRIHLQRRIRMGTGCNVGSESSCSSELHNQSNKYNDRIKTMVSQVQKYSQQKTHKPENSSESNDTQELGSHEHGQTDGTSTSSEKTIQSKIEMRYRRLNGKEHCHQTGSVFMPAEGAKDEKIQKEETAHVEFTQQSEPINWKFKGELASHKTSQMAKVAKGCFPFIYVVAIGAMLFILLLLFLKQSKYILF